jgi:hypothetical protein
MIMKCPAQIADYPRQLFIGSSVSTPGNIKQLVPGHYFIGMLGKTDEDIHRLGFKVVSLAVRARNYSPQRFNLQGT